VRNDQSREVISGPCQKSILLWIGRDTAPAPTWSANDVVRDALSNEDDDSGDEFVEDPNLYAANESESDNDDVARDMANNDDDGISVNADPDTDSSVEDDDDNIPFIMGEDDTTRWNLRPPRTRVRRAAQNIVVGQPGVKNVMKNAKMPLQAWELFFSESMLI